MKQLMSLPLTTQVLAEYEDMAEACGLLHLDGIEGVWGGSDLPVERLPKPLRVGYHLTFWPDWLDFWRGDTAALNRKFGAPSVWQEFYGGENGRETLLACYRADLARAVRWGAEYIVFHVSDISLEEGYTYRWEHTDRQVLEAGAEVINLLLEEGDYSFAFLTENQWWPGLTLTDAGLTRWFLDQIHYQNKGLLLDVGHLMTCNTALKTQEEGVAWIHQVLDGLGNLTGEIRGIHLHQSLSGAYVRANTGALPPGFHAPSDYLGHFGTSYGHVLKIDTHRPFTTPAITSVIERLRPQWLVHELPAETRKEREERVRIQKGALGHLV